MNNPVIKQTSRFQSQAFLTIFNNAWRNSNVNTHRSENTKLEDIEKGNWIEVSMAL